MYVKYEYSTNLKLIWNICMSNSQSRGFKMPQTLFMQFIKPHQDPMLHVIKASNRTHWTHTEH